MAAFSGGSRCYGKCNGGDSTIASRARQQFMHSRHAHPQTLSAVGAEAQAAAFMAGHGNATSFGKKLDMYTLLPGTLSYPRLGSEFYPPWHPGSSPACPVRHSSATHLCGRGHCRTLRSSRSRRGQRHHGAQRGGHRDARRSLTRCQAPPGAAAVHSGGATGGTTRLLLRSQGDLQRGDLYLPGRPVVVGMCVTHPRASSAVVAAAWGIGVSAEVNDALTRDKYGRTGTGACRFVPLSHETYGRAEPRPLRFSVSLQSLRPRMEQSPSRFTWRMRCTTFP